MVERPPEGSRWPPWQPNDKSGMDDIAVVKQRLSAQFTRGLFLKTKIAVKPANHLPTLHCSKLANGLPTSVLLTMQTLSGSRHSQCRLYTVHSRHWERRLQKKTTGVRKWVEVDKPVADFALKIMHAWGEASKPVADFSSFGYSRSRQWVCQFHQNLIMNSNVRLD